MEHPHTPKTPPQSPPPSTSPAVGAFMTNTAPPSKDFQEAVAKGYEPHDIGLRSVFIFLGGLTATMIVVLAFIYFVMMGLAEHDRSQDGVVSPLQTKVSYAPLYAPLQPSLGFDGNPDHDVLDAEDMIIMRYRADKVLNHAGITAGGRKYIAIDTAMDTVVGKSLLLTKAVLAPTTQPIYAEGIHEGSRMGVAKKLVDPSVHENDMNSLNPGDN